MSSQSGKVVKLAYYASTALLIFMMGVGGVLDTLRPASVLEGMATLGYPAYFPLILGPAKVIGVLALLAPVPAWMREWAYAGFFIDVVAAVISHLAAGDAAHVGPAIVGVALVVVSHTTYHRRLASSVPQRR
ncbi:MAG: DoxX family protein [Polyangiaceae bacterium]